MTDEKHDHDHCGCGDGHGGHEHKGHSHAEDDGCGCGHSHAHGGERLRVAPRAREPTDAAAKGDIVKVHYVGTLDDGEEFDSSKDRDPLEFVVGEHDVIRGFEDAVVGMKTGDKKTVTIAPEDAYGDPNPEMRQDVPREALGDIEPEEGMVLALHHPQMAQPLPARVIEVGEETVTLDLNHPLAGKTLTFDIELVEIR